MKRILTAMLMAVFLFLSGCATWGPHPPAVPFELPFAVHKAGETISTEMEIAQDRFYEFSLELYCKKEFKEDMRDCGRVKKLAGSGRCRKDEDGKYSLIHDGTCTPVKLRVIGLDDEVKSFYFDQEITSCAKHGTGGTDDDPTGASGLSFTRIIKDIRLKPGRYRLSVTSLEDIPELEGTRVTFRVGWYWNSAPFKEN